MNNLPIEIKFKICEYIDLQLKTAVDIYIEKKLNNNYFHHDLYSNFIHTVIFLQKTIYSFDCKIFYYDKCMVKASESRNRFSSRMIMRYNIWVDKYRNNYRNYLIDNYLLS